MTARACTKIAAGLNEALSVARGTTSPTEMHYQPMTPDTLRAWRDAHGLTQQAAAERLGIPLRTLHTLEYGRSPTSALWGPIARIIKLLDEQEAVATRRKGRAA